MAQLFCCKGSLIKDRNWAGPVCLGSSAKMFALSIWGAVLSSAILGDV